VSDPSDAERQLRQQRNRFGFGDHLAHDSRGREQQVDDGRLGRARTRQSGRREPTDPDKIADLFEAYLQKTTPKTVELKITRMHGGRPWITEYHNPYVQAAGRAIEKGFGKTPVFCREGGSIPVVSTFQEELGISAVLFGVGLPDENAHAPNERLDLDNFHNGIVAAAHLYEEIVRPQKWRLDDREASNNWPPPAAARPRGITKAQPVASRRLPSASLKSSS
jgi:hypothetical protein